jgi:hypothetical protein
MKLIALAIFLGLALIAAAIFVTDRYKIADAGIDESTGKSAVWRLDTFTGEVTMCHSGITGCWVVGR